MDEELLKESEVETQTVDDHNNDANAVYETTNNKGEDE